MTEMAGLSSPPARGRGEWGDAYQDMVPGERRQPSYNHLVASKHHWKQ